MSETFSNSSSFVYMDGTGGESAFAAPEVAVKAARGGLLAVDAKRGIVEAFAAAIGNKDSVNDIIIPGAFDKSLRRRKPRVVWGHDWNKPIGKVLEIYEVGANDPRLPAKMRANRVGGLYVKVQFNLKSERGRQAFADVEFFGEEQEWSIGYKTIDKSFDPVKKANILKEVELYEVSPVLHGANQLTGTISVKDAQAEAFDFGEQEEKAGRTIAARNMKKLKQALTLLQEVVEDGTIPEGMERKYDEKSLANDFEQKAADANDADMVYGNGDTVSAVTVVMDVKSRDEAADVLNAASDLVCCKGFFVQIPSMEKGGELTFFLPGQSDVKEAFGVLMESLSTMDDLPESRIETIGGFRAQDSVKIADLFTEPDSVG